MKLQPTKPAEYLKIAREIEAARTGNTVKLAVLSTFTADLLRPFVIVESHCLNHDITPWFGPFGQMEQQVFDDTSPLWNQSPDVLWIAARLEDVDRQLVHEMPEIGPDETRQRLTAIRERLVTLAQSARERHRGPILVSNFINAFSQNRHLFDASDPDGFVHLLAECNRELAHSMAHIGDVHIFDYAGTVTGVGLQNWSDPRLWYMARTACSSDGMIPLARNLVRSIIAVLRPPAKCLVLDLDNTLWGGVLGDDGFDGIVLGDDYPGNVFKDFQAALLGLRRRGFLLAIASKNHEQLVFDVIDRHPEMILRRHDFACICANWEPKPVNLRTISQQLNIGLDSLVFVDDNPVERATVRAELPMVHVAELPAEPLGYLAALSQIAVLDRPRLLAEDRRRAEMYQSESVRQQVAQQATSVEDFLQGLHMEARVGKCDSATIERIHQLIQKTNQFNLTTRRHSLEDIRQLMASEDVSVAWLRLRDRFGDLGLVCVGIVRRVDEEVWEIDTFLMSCRVMGRKVEDAFLSYLAELAKSAGAKRLRGVFRPTAKNSPVEDFFRDRGFTLLSNDLEQRFEATLSDAAFEWPVTISRIDERQPQENACV